MGITHTKALSWAAAIAVLINIPLNFYLIFTRELGISGAAIASSLAEMGSFMMLSFYMWIRLDKEKYGLRPVYNGNLLIKVLKLSTWSMLHAFISVALCIVKKYFQNERDTEGLFKRQSYVLFRKQYSGID